MRGERPRGRSKRRRDATNQARGHRRLRSPRGVGQSRRGEPLGRAEARVQAPERRRLEARRRRLFRRRLEPRDRRLVVDPARVDAHARAARGPGRARRALRRSRAEGVGGGVREDTSREERRRRQPGAREARVARRQRARGGDRRRRHRGRRRRRARRRVRERVRAGGDVHALELRRRVLRGGGVHEPQLRSELSVAAVGREHGGVRREGRSPRGGAHALVPPVASAAASATRAAVASILRLPVRALSEARAGFEEEERPDRVDPGVRRDERAARVGARRGVPGEPNRARERGVRPENRRRRRDAVGRSAGVQGGHLRRRAEGRRRVVRQRRDTAGPLPAGVARAVGARDRRALARGARLRERLGEAAADTAPVRRRSKDAVQAAVLGRASPPTRSRRTRSSRRARRECGEIPSRRCAREPRWRAAAS